MKFIFMDELCESSFWDANITWYTEYPDFTDCFKNTALIWLPCFFLWIFSPLEFYFLRKSKAREIPLNKYNTTKLTFIILLIMQILIQAINDTSKPSIYIHTSILKFLTFILFFILTWANIKMGVRSSGILFMYSLLLMICNLPQIRTIASINNQLFDNGTKLFQFISEIFNILPVIVIFLLNCFADSKPRYFLCKKAEHSDPSHDASFLSKLYLHWFNYFVWKNYKKPIDNILWNLQDDEKTDYLLSKFESHWSSSAAKRSDAKIELEELGKLKNKFIPPPPNCSVLKPTLKMFWLEILSCLFWKTMEMFSVLSYPLIFSLFLTFIVDKEPAWKGYLCSFMFLVNGLLQAVILNKMYINLIVTQAKIKAVLMSVVYKKALKISNGIRKQYTIGDIVNLLSVDAERISGSFKPLVNSCTSPVQVTLSCYFVWNILGVSVLASLIVITVLLPIINILMKRMKQLQTVEMKNKDKRGKFIQELLAGIKVLKMYAWEPYFQKEVFRLRKKEMKIIRKHAHQNALILFTFSCVPFLMSSATFTTYVLSSAYNSLNVRKAFVTISFFNALRNPLQQLPDAISNLSQAMISVKRINQFLNLEELDPNIVSHENTDEALIIEDGSFSWNDNSKNPTLHDLNIKIPQGKIVSVVGPVGSGKSSLIAAFLGEMYKLQGYVNTKGKIAYVSQQAWILNATVKENIILGKPVNESLYEKVLEACALKPDLASMPDHDLTEIGEKGINLSGGQKQRVSLARALCHDADIYFLDDPLSSVDFHIANHIFQYALGSNGMLKNKTRLIVTNATAFLSQTDLVIVLKNGHISEIGTYLSLKKKDGDFAEYLRTYSNQNDREKELDSVINESEEIKTKSNLHEAKEPLQKDSNQKSVQNLTKLTVREHLETGKIKRKVYAFYLSAIGVYFTSASLIMYILYQILSVLSNIWLLRWSTAENPSNNSTQGTTNRYFYFEVYVALGVAEALAILIGNLILFSGLLRASSYFHDALLTSILKWPTWLLDSTPVGRIINRFTADIFILDGNIGPKIVNVIIFSSRLLSICFVIIYTTPICAVVVVPVLITLYVVQKFHSSLAHQISRIESINKSPLYSCFVETISGLQSVRAYKYQNQSISRACEKIDRCSASFMSNFICLRCLATKMDILGGCIGFFASFFVISERNSLDIGLIGFSMSYSIQMTRELTWLLLRSLEIENGIVAIERIKDFIEQPQEAPSYLPTDSKHAEWPQKGEIILENYSLRYRKNLDLVLNNISFEIHSGEKIGIVGRTGAGKTSLILGLFRLIEPASGKILIDGVDIAGIGLHLLRSRLTLIPQDPVLFLGTLRFNLDPTGMCNDENLWEILEKAHLKNFVRDLPGGLQYGIDEGGGNISYGQKQLICLARALLRKTKVLILDEATASVDMETDELVQKTIRDEFAECTVLTIAHRLNTVQDYDRILVIHNGLVAEFDTPSNLVESKTSLFHNMAQEFGLL